MNDTFRIWWRTLTTTRGETQAGTPRRSRFFIGRHTAWLEAEVERLRAECAETRRHNWALVNSLVTTAGAPLPEEVLRQSGHSAEPAAADAAGARGDRSSGGARGRRSWHQLARALEIESARDVHRAAQGKGE